MIKSKDPAALFYISDWLTSTAEMDADCRGWYLNLILHQYDKGDLPNDIEKLALLASVKFSEYERFKQVFEQVLKQKFRENDNNRLENEKAKTIIQKREQFKDKRSNSGKIGYLVKIAYTITSEPAEIEHIKKNFDFDNKYTKDKQVLKQMLKQMLKLYRNENENKINYESVIKDFNKATGKKIRVADDKFKRQLSARLKEGFTISEIIEAAHNCSKDEYHIENPKYLTPEFITRADKLQKFINVKKSEYEDNEFDNSRFKIHRYS